MDSSRPPEELTPEEAAEDLAPLAAAIAAADRASHGEDAPQITDAEYDAMTRRHAALEAAFPELRRPDSPSERVGAPPSSPFPKLRHSMPMLSLENAF